MKKMIVRGIVALSIMSMAPLAGQAQVNNLLKKAVGKAAETKVVQKAKDSAGSATAS